MNFALAKLWLQKWRWYERNSLPWNRARHPLRVRARARPSCRWPVHGNVLEVLREGASSSARARCSSPACGSRRPAPRAIRIGEGSFLNLGVMVAARRAGRDRRRTACSPTAASSPTATTASTTRPARSRGRASRPRARRAIGDNVWCGANVVITSGVTIGERCVIGANSRRHRRTCRRTRSPPARRRACCGRCATSRLLRQYHGDAVDTTRRATPTPPSTAGQRRRRRRRRGGRCGAPLAAARRRGRATRYSDRRSPRRPAATAQTTSTSWPQSTATASCAASRPPRALAPPREQRREQPTTISARRRPGRPRRCRRCASRRRRARRSAAAHGSVSTQATTMLPATPQRTADSALGRARAHDAAGDHVRRRQRVADVRGGEDHRRAARPGRRSPAPGPS